MFSSIAQLMFANAETKFSQLRLGNQRICLFSLSRALPTWAGHYCGE
jgi:hypothetical protein